MSGFITPDVFTCVCVCVFVSGAPCLWVPCVCGVHLICAFPCVFVGPDVEIYLPVHVLCFFSPQQAVLLSSPLMTISSTMDTATRVSRGSWAPPTVTPTRTGSELSVSPAKCSSAVCLRTSTKVRVTQRAFEDVLVSVFAPPHLSSNPPPDEITSSFRRFGHLVVDWPHKAESKSYFPPKGTKKRCILGWMLYL